MNYTTKFSDLEIGDTFRSKYNHHCIYIKISEMGYKVIKHKAGQYAPEFEYKSHVEMNYLRKVTNRVWIRI